MNRRLNTIAFLAAATVVNLVLMFFYFLAFTGIAGLFLPVRTGVVAVGFWIGLFVASLMATWFTYRWGLALLMDRLPLKRYLDSRIFKGKL